MSRSLQNFRRTKTNELAGMSKHALMARMYKEIYNQLDKCLYVMKNRGSYSINEFFTIKGKCLTKVISIVSYLINTTEMSADEEIGELFVKMYNYIYANATEANMRIDSEAVARAKNMTYKLMEVWNSIPEKDRY